jgi:hypothetical protein
MCVLMGEGAGAASACARRAMLIVAGAFPINVRRPWTWIG